jgi:hypothetical protein
MIIKAWLDSGANIHSKKRIEIEVDDEVWVDLTDQEKNDLVFENIGQYFEWGWDE